MKTLHDLGEFGLIERFARQVTSGPGVVKGIGDDTAVIDTGAPEYLLMTTDLLVEGRHFLRTTMSAHEIGRKALACSISDIAAMGGTPTWALVSLGAPSNMSARFIEEIGHGINALAGEYGVSVVGGDTVCHERIIINVSLLGTVARDEVVFRDGARPGNRIFVTGALGNSFHSRRHLTFTPRVKESRYLVQHARPTAMIDISDGLAGDLGHILSQSRVGAVIDAAGIPLAKGASLDQALHDGEDFELLLTVPAVSADRLRRCRRFRFYEIGEITAPRGLFLRDRAGKKQRLRPRGFEHF